ncbi:hypothetical protein [cyanobacterium endosymbiont of Epithemia turgida]|uniref:hypothetical protein n=1 Tax=cyanobacterium endosymbiont of Epithemia turgida TaxID=718217 RepID=UPI0038CD86E3
MDSGDEIAQAWLGHPAFTDKEGRELTVCRISNFFGIFPIVLTQRKELSVLTFPSAV